ncbi:MAG: leucine-rich repeat protein, partial [Clostridia bacterium]|nr:leucine-rich repeat protein [Clostridia bacterium]
GVVSILSVIWAIGAALMLAYAAFSYLALWYRVRESIKENGVYICDNIGSPFVFGIIRPRIYIPSGMDEKNLAYVLAHEKAHIKRLDPVWRLLGFILLSVYWFAPLAWIAYVLFCRDIELACDERVIRTLDPVQRAGYSEALLELTQPHRTISACPVAFGETGVKARIKKVFGYKKPTVFIIAAALILCTVLGACLMTDPKDAEEPEYTKEIDMYMHSDYYIEFRIPEDTANIYTIAVKDGVISYRRIYETAGLRKTEDRVLIEKDGVLSLLFTDDRAYLNPTDDFSEVLSSARRGGTKKLVSHTQDGDTETFTFEKDGNTLAFIYEKGELKRMAYGDAGENGALTEREILLFTDKIPDDILFAVPDDYTYAAADTPEDAYGSTVEYCNHYAEYDIKDFDIAAYLEELNNNGFTATLTESADSCYAYINFGKDVVLVERFENAGKAAQAYRDYLRGVFSDGSHISTMAFDDPPFRSAFRVNEYLFDVFHNFYYDTSTSFVAKMIGLLGINVPVYSGPENRIIKHIGRALDENFAVILAETGYTVVEQDEGALSSLGGRTWLVIAPDGSAATVVRCESKYDAEVLVYAHRTTIESGKIPVTVAVLDGGCVVFVHHAAADAFISLITGVKTPDIPEHTDDGFFNFTLLEDGTYEITAKNTESIPSEVVIPSKHDGKNVTSIGREAFFNCSGIVSVTIPESVTDIGERAFRKCS